MKFMNNDEIRDFCIKKDLKIYELQKELDLQLNIKKKAIKYIKEHCIDDECYINLTNKEKNIFDVLMILEYGDDIS